MIESKFRNFQLVTFANVKKAMKNIRLNKSSNGYIAAENSCCFNRWQTLSVNLQLAECFQIL